MIATLQDIRLLRDAAAVKRFHVKRTIREQSVGEHTFGVLMLLRALAPDDISATDLCTLLFAVMHHDLPELVTGDLPAPVKRQYPELGAMLDRIEGESGILHYAMPLSAEEKTMLKWADTTELILWCLEEHALGNRNLDRTISRALGYLLEMSPVPWPRADEFTTELVVHCFDVFGITPMRGTELEHNT